MRDFFQSFDNREIAVCVWVLGFICWAACKPGVRSSISGVIRAALAKQIVAGVIIFAIYFVGLIGVLSIIGVWAVSQLKVTLFWFFSAGLSGLASAAKVEGGEARLWEKAKTNFSISVFLDFFINLYRMPLFIELMFVPFTAVIGAVVAYSSHDKKYEKVEILGNKLIIGIGALVLAYAAYETAINYDNVINVDNFRALILPVAFSLGMLPMFWAGMIYVTYENVFVRVPFLIRDESLHRYAKLALVRAFRTDTQRLHVWFRKAWLAKLDSVEAIDLSIAETVSVRDKA